MLFVEVLRPAAPQKKRKVMAPTRSKYALFASPIGNLLQFSAGVSANTDNGTKTGGGASVAPAREDSAYRTAESVEMSAIRTSSDSGVNVLRASRVALLQQSGSGKE